MTGANRGIGFEIAHQLASHGLTIVLTSRETAVGEEAAKVLQEGGLNVVFHQLDITDPSSIKACADWVQETYGGLDILVRHLFCLAFYLTFFLHKMQAVRFWTTSSFVWFCFLQQLIS